MIRLTANVNRKDCENYNSRSYGATIEVELASGDGAKIQDTLDRLYAELNTAVDRQFAQSQQPQPTPAPKPDTSNIPPHRSPSPPSRNGNGGPTQAQIRAIFGIAKSMGIDTKNGGLADYLSPHQVSRPEDLSVKQASQVIEQLKADQASQSAYARGGQR